MQTNSTKYKFCKLYLTITRFIISLTKIHDVHLGTRVIYHGRRYYVNDCNTVIRGKHIFELGTIDFQFPVYARRFEFKKELDFDNIWHDATAWWVWYKRHRLEIDARAMARFDQLGSIKVLGKHRAHGKGYRFK